MFDDLVKSARDTISSALPPGCIVADHDETGHYYLYQNVRCPSVTTKTKILEKEYLAKWKLNTAADYIKQHINSKPLEDLLIEAFQVADKERDEAADIGTRAHNIIEDYINSQIATTPSKLKAIEAFIPTTESESRVISCVRAGGKFMDEWGVLPVWSELLVAHSELAVAGTLDFLAFVPRETVEGKKDCQHDFYRAGKKPERLCITCGKREVYELALIDWKTSNSIDKAEYIMQVAAYNECLKKTTKLKVKRIIIVQLDKFNASYTARELDMKAGQDKQAFGAFSAVNHVHHWLGSIHAKLQQPPKKVLKLADEEFTEVQS